MTRRILNSLLWATAIVATGSVLVLYDPALMAAYRSIAPKSQSVETLADFLTGLYEPYVLLAFAVLYAVVVPVLRWRRFSVLFGTMLTQALLIDFLKHVFSRVRPDGVPAGVFLGPQWHQWQHSFPGGHAAAAFALAVECEALARMYWQALQIGEPVILDAAEMARVLERFADYRP